MTTLDFDNIFKCKDLSSSSIETYKTKFKKLNDDKPIRNINFILEMDKIKEKIAHLKPNTQRTYYIAICSVLKCLINDKQANKKIVNIYNQYSKILDEYNLKLKDQTNKTETEGENWISQDNLKEIYDNLKLKHRENPRAFQDYLILSLYYLIPPRRNKDYVLLKVIANYNDKLPNDYNYIDMKNKKFYFNNYKTAKKYNQQVVDIPNELFNIISEYIKTLKIKFNDYLLYDINSNNPLNSNNAMTLLLNKIFKKKISSSMLRKLYLTNKYGDQAKELKNDVANMGTSISTAQNNYIKS